MARAVAAHYSLTVRERNVSIEQRCRVVLAAEFSVGLLIRSCFSMFEFLKSQVRNRAELPQLIQLHGRKVNVIVQSFASSEITTDLRRTFYLIIVVAHCFAT